MGTTIMFLKTEANQATPNGQRTATQDWVELVSVASAGAPHDLSATNFVSMRSATSFRIAVIA